MVSISYASGCGDFLIFKFGGDNFREILNFCRTNHFKFDDTTKLWALPINKYDYFIQYLKMIYEDIDVDLAAQEKVAVWKRGLCELRKSPSRLIWHQELLKHPPLVGKHPNENFQFQDIMRAIHQNRFLFNWEMGLGKSYTLTALIEHLRFYGKIKKCLIFSTPIGVNNLKDEILKFSTTLKSEDILSIASASVLPFEDRDIFNLEKYHQDLIIMPYDCLKAVSNYYYDKANATKRCPHPSTKNSHYRKNFMPVKEWIGDTPAGIFLDENHSIARVSRRSQIMNRIIPEFEYRYLFTGTLADVYEKLYEPCWILDKKLINGLDYDGWLSSYNERGNKYSAGAVNPDGWNLRKLGLLNKELLNNYGSKRLMVECLDLPPNIEVPVHYVGMSALQRKIYESFSNYTMSSAQQTARDKNTTLSDEVLNKFAYIQMAVDNPECLKRTGNFDNFPPDLQNLINKYSYEKDNTKLEMIDAIVEDKSGELNQKGIIWYYHPETEQALTKHFKKYKPYVVNNAVPRNDRIPLVKKFLSDPDSKLIIASINILNTSVTMVECKYEVYAEKTYNYTDYKQSRGRIFRPGQTEVTETHSLRFADSIDNLQEMNLNTKGETLKSLMNKEYIEYDLWKKLFNLQNADSNIF